MIPLNPSPPFQAKAFSSLPSTQLFPQNATSSQSHNCNRQLITRSCIYCRHQFSILKHRLRTPSLTPVSEPQRGTFMHCINPLTSSFLGCSDGDLSDGQGLDNGWMKLRLMLICHLIVEACGTAASHKLFLFVSIHALCCRLMSFYAFCFHLTLANLPALRLSIHSFIPFGQRPVTPIPLLVRYHLIYCFRLFNSRWR
jgi:hypothetical protein